MKKESYYYGKEEGKNNKSVCDVPKNVCCEEVGSEILFPSVRFSDVGFRKSKIKEKNKRIRYYMLLREMIANREQCFYCSNLAQTIHHIDENQANNIDENYMPVCHSCHEKIEHFKKPNDYSIVLPPTFKRKRHKRKTNNGKRKLITLICPHCSEKFVQSRKDQKYCSSKCRFSAWALKHPRVFQG